MINVSDCSYVTMRFISLKFFLLCHFNTSIILAFFNYNNLERVKGIEPSQPAWKAGVLPLNYTRTFPNVSHSLVALNFLEWWRGKDSNLRRPKSTGLQPAPFDRFGTPPYLGVTPFSIKLSTTRFYMHVLK